MGTPNAKVLESRDYFCILGGLTVLDQKWTIINSASFSDLRLMQPHKLSSFRVLSIQVIVISMNDRHDN